MNIRDLEYLVALANTGHFGRAAEACHVSQPTLSTQIKKLENELGAVLVERHSRRVWVTPLGQEVVKQAQNIIDSAHTIRDLAKGVHGTLAGALKIGGIPTVGPYVFPHILPVLQAQYPDLRPYLLEEKTDDLLALLRRGEIDAGLLALPLEDGEDLVQVPLYTEPFVLAMAKGHPLSHHKTINPEMLSQLDLMLLDEGHCLRDQALDVCRRAGAREHQEVRATSLETLRHMVAAGLGCTLLPAFAVRADDTLAVRPFSRPVPGREIGLVWRRGYPGHQALIEMAEMLKRSLKVPQSG